MWAKRVDLKKNSDRISTTLVIKQIALTANPIEQFYGMSSTGYLRFLVNLMCYYNCVPTAWLQ